MTGGIRKPATTNDSNVRTHDRNNIRNISANLLRSGTREGKRMDANTTEEEKVMEQWLRHHLTSVADCSELYLLAAVIDIIASADTLASLFIWLAESRAKSIISFNGSR